MKLTLLEKRREEQKSNKDRNLNCVGQNEQILKKGNRCSTLLVLT